MMIRPNVEKTVSLQPEWLMNLKVKAKRSHDEICLLIYMQWSVLNSSLIDTL